MSTHHGDCIHDGGVLPAGAAVAAHSAATSPSSSLVPSPGTAAPLTALSDTATKALIECAVAPSSAPARRRSKRKRKPVKKVAERTSADGDGARDGEAGEAYEDEDEDEVQAGEEYAPKPAKKKSKPKRKAKATRRGASKTSLAGKQATKHDKVLCLCCGLTVPDRTNRMAPCVECNVWSHSLCNGVFANSPIPVDFTCRACRGESAVSVAATAPWWTVEGGVLPTFAGNRAVQMKSS